MAIKPIDINTEYIPPRRLARQILIVAVNVFTAFIVFFCGIQDSVIWFQILCILVGILLSVVVCLGLYEIFFYHIPYTLSQEGIYIRNVGIIPWMSIDKVIYENHVGYKLSHTYVVRFQLRDVSFLDSNNKKRQRIEKEKSVSIVLGDGEECNIVEAWVSRYCRDLQDTRYVRISVWQKSEREYTPVYVSDKNSIKRYEGINEVSGIPILDSHHKLKEDISEYVDEMNEIIEGILNILKEERYEALQSIFYNKTRVNGKEIRDRVVSLKKEGRLKEIPDFNKQARKKIVVAKEKEFIYYYELTDPRDVLNVSLFVPFSIRKDTNQIQAYYPGKDLLMIAQDYPEIYKTAT